MFVALALMVMAGVILNLRSRLAQVEQRLALIEGGEVAQEAPPASRAFAYQERAAERKEAPPLHAVPAEPLEPPILAYEQDRPSAVTDEAPLPFDTPAEAVDAPKSSRGAGFEELFGRRLPIWAGGATLAVAGVLLVKYSIEAGLLAPWVRVLLGLVFGMGLIGGAELALREEARVRDPRVRQALAGAGLATLYAAILAAHNLYDLVGPATAFTGLAFVTALAMILSIRFGAPSALLGLVGGLAAPALVSAGQPNVPLLSGYLALAIGGLCALSRTQRWMWLGVGALVGGAGWAVALLALGMLDVAASVSIALLLIALGAAFPLLAFSGTRADSLRVIAAIVAAAQMAGLVATGGFTLLNWGLFGLLSLALVWLSGRRQAMRPSAAVGLAVALFLAGAWPSPDMTLFTTVLLGMTMIYGAPAMVRLWRFSDGLIEAGQIAAVALGAIATAMIHFHQPDRDMVFALIAIGVSALPVLGMVMGWRKAARHGDLRFALLATSAALLLSLSGGLAFPQWCLPLVAAVAASGLLILSRRAADRHVEFSGWAFAAAALVLLFTGASLSSELARSFGEYDLSFDLRSAMRWFGLALVAALFAWRAQLARGRVAAQVIAVLLGYGAAAQIVPAAWLAIVPAIALAVVVEASRRVRAGALLPALATALIVSLGWAIAPLGAWMLAAARSIAAEPTLASALPTMHETATRLATPALAIFVTLSRMEGLGFLRRRVLMAMVTILGGTAAHILYKQLFHLSNMDDVVRLALAERTLWQSLLLATAYGVFRFAKARRLSLVLIGAAIGHFVLYTLLLHNPLWWPQNVGGLPLFNLLTPAFLTPFAALYLGRHIAPDHADRTRRPAGLLQMIVISLFAYATLRQIFAGSLLTAMPVGEGEDILRSVLAVALAIGFLLWGVRTRLRDWRIASLLLMLCAVAKVFLFDASGLHGLLRIASFLALGFSLIGIGWLYNRVLRDMPN